MTQPTNPASLELAQARWCAKQLQAQRDAYKAQIEERLDALTWTDLDRAVRITRAVLDEGIHVIADRADNPAAHPEYGEATLNGITRRVLARLIDDGWIPPTGSGRQETSR